MTVKNTVVACSFFLPGTWLQSQPQRPIPNYRLLLGDRHVCVCVCEQLAQRCYLSDNRMERDLAGQSSTLCALQIHLLTYLRVEPSTSRLQVNAPTLCQQATL